MSLLRLLMHWQSIELVAKKEECEHGGREPTSFVLKNLCSRVPLQTLKWQDFFF